MYLKFYLENQRMPDVAEMNDICKSLFVAVKAIAPKTEYEEFYRIVEKRETGYETRILKDIQSGITLETFMAKGHRKKQLLRNKRGNRGEQNGKKKQEII
jgi:RecJ-like exonuclease